MKAYTDLEQSKKLAEILPLESADMARCGGENVIMTDYISAKKKFSVCGELTITPCWSLDALINLLPSEFTTENKFGIFKYTICIRKYKFTEDEDVHQIAYGNYKYYEDGSSSWKDMINTGQKENLIDAAFDMICWLKKYGYE